MKIKSSKRLVSITSLITLVAGFALTGIAPVKSSDVSPDNPMLHFTMKVRWGNVIDDPVYMEETNFDGSISVSSDARISLQRKLLFDWHNNTADRITSRKDPVSWNSLIYGHWDGVMVTVSSPANDEVTIATSQGDLTMTAQEFYDLSESYTQSVGDNEMEIVVDVYPAGENPNYFLKIYWGKVDRTNYLIKRCTPGTEGTAKCHIPLINANGSFKIDSGGTLQLAKTLRFEGRDLITGQTDTEISWNSDLYGGVDGILINLKLNSVELDDSDTVTLNFTNGGWTKSFSIIDLYHDKLTGVVVTEDGYGVVLQVWQGPNRSLIRIRNKPTVYMLEDGVKRPVPSPEVLESQGLTFDDVEVVEQEEADTYADANPVNYADGTIVQEDGKPEVYVVADGEKKHITDPTAFAALGYNWNNIVKVKPGVLGLFHLRSAMKSNSVHPEGALIREEGTNTVYLIEGGKKKPISSLNIFNARRLNWNKVLVINKAQMNKFQSGANLQYPDGALVRDPAGKVYRMNQGKKQWIRSGNDFAGAGYKAENIIDVTDATEINDLAATEEGNDIVADDTAANL